MKIIYRTLNVQRSLMYGHFNATSVNIVINTFYHNVGV